VRRGVVDVPGGRFYYLEVGDQEAPLVLCLHGFPDHPPSFGPLATRLAAAGHRVAAPWMRGYAPSQPTGPYDADRLGADAVELATALGGGAPVALVGHDWGAVATYAALAAAPARFRCAVTMAVPHPLAFARALVADPAQVARSWYMLFFQLPWLPERVVVRDDLAFVDRLWRDWSPGFRLDESDRAELFRCLAESMPAPLAYYRALLWPPGQALRRLRLASAPHRRIEVPTLHLHGADDGCIGPGVGAGQERFFRGPFRSAVVDGAGHFLQLERPDTVAEHVLGWLRAHGR
jgi:pimeloyl-ACP methyl ester carboxylesterase